MRDVAGRQHVYSMAVSAAGRVAYCKYREATQGTLLQLLWSLHVVENGEVRTVIPDTTDYMKGLTFLQIAGREQLLVYREPNFVLMSSDLHKVERKLHELKRRTPLCRSGENKALYLQRTGVRGVREVWELEVTSDTHHDTQKAILRLGWEGVHDMCTAGGLLVLCSSHDKSVAGVSLSDWQVKWKVSMDWPWSVCPGTPGSVCVPCPDSSTIQQLSLQDGTVLTQLPLVPGVETPWCVRNHNDTLYVAHYDAEVWVTKGQRNMAISQHRFK